MENIAKLKPFEKIVIVRNAINLSPIQKLILLTIATHIGNNKIAWLSYEMLMKECAINSRTTISNNLKKLIDIGYLKVYEPNPDHKSNQYEIIFNTILSVQEMSINEDTSIDTMFMPVQQMDCTSPLDGLLPVQQMDSKEQLNNNERTLIYIAHEHDLNKIQSNDVQSNKGDDMSKIYTNEKFDEFWSVYPRKQGKKRATKIWETKKLDNIADRIITDVLEKCRYEKQWQDKQFIPHASTYLNGERWNDEIIDKKSTDKFNVGDYLLNKVRKQYERKNEEGMGGSVVSEISDDIPKKMVREFY